jgi:hypothetical protein
MIIYDLQCAAGHQFEGWFDDGDAYEAQRGSCLIACPVCSDINVTKVPSTFAIKGASPQNRGGRYPTDMEMIGRSISAYLEKNFDDVGCDFAKEALKIHYGVSDRKNIRGTSTKEEEKLLEKEGVPFFKVPLPVPPPDSDV